MKRLLLFALVAILFSSCSKDDDYIFRTDAYVYLPFKGQSKQVAFSGDQFRKFKVCSNYSGRTWTAHDIVRRDDVYLACTDTTMGDPLKNSRGFWPELRDTVNDMLLFRAEDILTAQGELYRGFLYSYIDYYILVGKYDQYNLDHNPDLDTVGYIPNATIIEARKHIEELYEAEKYDEIYEYFHHAFEIIPCTGSEYKALVEQGLQ